MRLREAAEIQLCPSAQCVYTLCTALAPSRESAHELPTKKRILFFSFCHHKLCYVPRPSCELGNLTSHQADTSYMANWQATGEDIFNLRIFGFQRLQRLRTEDPEGVKLSSVLNLQSSILILQSSILNPWSSILILRSFKEA